MEPLSSRQVTANILTFQSQEALTADLGDGTSVCVYLDDKITYFLIDDDLGTMLRRGHALQRSASRCVSKTTTAAP
jgi:hypothetical protein